ncbi:MAG: tetratricopeptide repeat protein [Anaerolineae bacterium]
MRIERSRSRLSFRKRRRRSGGCFSILFSVVLLGGVGAVSWLWINRLITPTNNSNAGLMASAQNAFDRGDLSGAITLTRQILVDQPDDITALRLLVRSLVYRSYSDYNRTSDQTTALDATTEAIRRQPTNPDLLAIHAFALQAAGRVDDAADAAQRALENQPNYTLARTALALAYGGAGALEAALRESQRAVQSATAADNAIDALRALAITYSDTGSYDDAARTVERAIALNGNLVTLYFERAQYALLVGDSDAATVAYFEVLTHDENNVKARLRLCELSSLMRERDQAVQYCQEVTQRAPSWSEGWYRLGMEHFLQGNFDEAQSDLHRCSTLQVLQNVPISERRFECWYIQGQAAEIRGDCDSLIATYNEFRAMNADAQIQQRWTYPPEGPPGCSTPLRTPTLQ